METHLSSFRAAGQSLFGRAEETCHGLSELGGHHPTSLRRNALVKCQRFFRPRKVGSLELAQAAGTVRANFLAITSTSCDPTVSRMSPTFYNFYNFPAISCTRCDPTVSKRMSPMRVQPTMAAIRNPKKTATGTSSSELCNPT